MKSKTFKNLIVFSCVFFILAGLTKNTIAKEETSVLSRVQKIDDPELGELIRIALENINTPEIQELAKFRPEQPEYKKLKSIIQLQELQTVRKVTEAYSDIKLLDSQIEQINKKINSSSSPEKLSYELILAKAELEAKLTDKLAELRETMNIIPIHAFGRRSVEQLNTWIKLDVIGEQVAVFNCSKPFNEIAYQMNHNFVKLMSRKEAFDYVTNNVKELPIRIDILRNTDGIELSEKLNKQIIDFIKDKNLEIQAEVHLDDHIRTQPATSDLIIQDKIIGTTIDGSSNSRGTRERLSGIIDPNGIESYIQRRLSIASKKANEEIEKPLFDIEQLNLNNDEKAILNCLDREPTHIEQIISQTTLTAGSVNAGLISLRLKSLIKQLPGSLFVKR